MSNIVLRLLVQHCDEQAGIGKIQLVEIWLDMPSNRKFRKVQPPTYIDNTGVTQPFDATPVVLCI